MAISTAGANLLLDNALDAQTYYMSLHTADPSTTGANEATGGSYARQAITIAAAASGQKKNSAAATFSAMGAGTYSYAGIWTASVAGTFVQGTALASPVTVSAGQNIEFAANAVVWVLTEG